MGISDRGTLGSGYILAYPLIWALRAVDFPFEIEALRVFVFWILGCPVLDVPLEVSKRLVSGL